MKRIVAILIACNILSLGAVIVLLIFTISGKMHARVTELDAERLNIIGMNGRPVLVLSNRRLIPGPSMNGKDYPRGLADGRELVSGMIFFNEEGDEVGGLIFNGIPKESGYSSVGHLSFDQWKQNQVVALQYIDSGKSRRAGLTVWDRPTNISMDQQLDLAVRILEEKGAKRDSLKQAVREARERGEYGVQRLFVGSRDRSAQVLLRDIKGRTRIRLYVAETDEARLEFLDETGAIVSRYPPGE